MSSDVSNFVISTILGWVAFVFAVAGCLPQSIKVFKTKDTQSISLVTYILYCIGCIVWIAWSIGYMYECIDNLNNGAYNDLNLGLVLGATLPTLFLNSICLVLAFIILYIKCRNFIGAKKLKISEREFTKKWLKERSKK